MNPLGFLPFTFLHIMVKIMCPDHLNQSKQTICLYFIQQTVKKAQRFHLLSLPTYFKCSLSLNKLSVQEISVKLLIFQTFLNTETPSVNFSKTCLTFPILPISIKYKCSPKLNILHFDLSILTQNCVVWRKTPRKFRFYTKQKRSPTFSLLSESARKLKDCRLF